jgi:hypothetical protein
MSYLDEEPEYPKKHKNLLMKYIKRVRSKEKMQKINITKSMRMNTFFDHLKGKQNPIKPVLKPNLTIQILPQKQEKTKIKKPKTERGRRRDTTGVLEGLIEFRKDQEEARKKSLLIGMSRNISGNHENILELKLPLQTIV